jgi:phosphatidylserine/phosphatidylglycerophosphate/cardiolipin synthase-like enzyme
MAGQIPTNEVLIGSDYPKKLYDIISNARRSVLVLMFDWRFYPNEPASVIQKVNNALGRAVSRGVTVRCLVNSPVICSHLKELGLDARVINSSDMLHSKLVVVDDEAYFIGSHNLTKNAFHYNFETSIYSFDPEGAKILSDYFKRLCLL